MRPLVLLAISVFFFGCAAQTAMVDIPTIDQSSLVAIKDLRPETEKEDETFSLMISNEAYGTYRRGDKLVDPTPIRILQHRIHEKYSTSVTAPDTNVHHFAVYMNLKSELRRGVAGGFLGGMIGMGVAAGTQKYGVDGLASLTTEEEFMSVEEEYKRALYTQDENPEKVSVYIVYLDAELDGKRSFIRTMTPTRLPKGDERNPHVVAIEAAIAYFLDQY